MSTANVLERADLDPCPLEDPDHRVRADAGTPLWDRLLAERTPVRACASEERTA